MTELYGNPINFEDFLLPAPSAMRTPTFTPSLPTSASYPPNLFANPTPSAAAPQSSLGSATATPFPPIVDTNPAYPEYDPALDFFSTQPPSAQPQTAASLGLPFATPSPTTAAAQSFLSAPPAATPSLYSAYHAPPTTHFTVPNTGAGSSSLFGTPTTGTTTTTTLPPVQPAPIAASSTSTITTPRRRKATTSPTPGGTTPAIDKHKLEERRRKNRLSSSKCYYNRKKQIELVERTLTDEKKRAIQLYETELKLRQENARLKKELVLKNIRIPPSFMTTTRTEAFARPSVL